MIRSLAASRIPIPIASVLAIVPVLVMSPVSASTDTPRRTETRMAAVDTPSGERTEEPPNVLLILTDDQGCGDAGFMGNPELATPNLDRLSGGTAFQYQTDPARHRGLGVHRDWISRWNTSGAEAVWRIAVQEATEYEISVRVRCPDGIEGRAPAARIEVGAASAAGTLSACRSSGAPEWTVQQVGTLTLSAGRTEVRVTVHDLASESDLDLSHLVFERLDTDRTRARPV